MAYSSVSIVVLQQQQQENITHVVHKVPFGWHFGLGRFPYEFMKLSKEEGVVLVEGEHDCIARGEHLPSQMNRKSIFFFFFICLIIVLNVSEIINKTKINQSLGVNIHNKSYTIKSKSIPFVLTLAPTQ